MRVNRGNLPPNAALGAYLDRVAGEPWAWGRSDCFTFMIGWTMAAFGRNAVLPPYDSAGAAFRMVRQMGGMLELGHRLAAQGGARPIDRPAAGDIGLVHAPVRRAWQRIGGTVCAICVGDRWAIRAEQGLAIDFYPHAAAWTF